MKTIHAALFAAVAVALAPFATHAQQQFPTPQAAADALVQALSAPKPDEKQMAALLGGDWRAFVPVGTVDRADVDAFLAMYRAKHAFQPAPEGGQLLVVGGDGWTLPVPLKKARDGWHFDMEAGAAEIRARRVGRNELDVISALRAYHDAQMDYAEVDRDGDGVLEYAQTLVSTACAPKHAMKTDEVAVSTWCSGRMVSCSTMRGRNMHHAPSTRKIEARNRWSDADRMPRC